MEKQSLHSEGEADYLKVLRYNFEELIKKLKKDNVLSKEEKEKKIKTAKEEYEINTKSKQRLF